MKTSRLLGLTAIALTVACSAKSDDKKDKKGGASLPALNAERLPPEAKGVIVGEATEADVLKAFPTVKLNKDQSLGGEGVVRYNDTPAIAFSDSPDAPVKATIEGTILQTSDGIRVVRFTVSGTGLCNFAKDKIGALDGAKSCPGNRKTGESDSGSYYCMTVKDKPVMVDCTRGKERDSLTYAFEWK